MSCSKQKGGGVFDVFCPLCNLPFYSPFEGQKPLTDDDEDEEGEEAEKQKESEINTEATISMNPKLNIAIAPGFAKQIEKNIH